MSDHLGTFANLNQDISTRIYQRFTQGKVIPMYTYNKHTSCFEDDADYTYLFRYKDEFTLLYKCIGKYLEHHVQGEFFYINSILDSDLDEADEHALKVQSMLLVLSRHFEETGRNMHHLSDDSLGFNEKDIADIASNEEYQAIAKALRIGTWHKGIEYLVLRGFAFETSTNHYFLSSAGTAFCNNVLSAYKEVR